MVLRNKYQSLEHTYTSTPRLKTGDVGVVHYNQQNVSEPIPILLCLNAQYAFNIKYGINKIQKIVEARTDKIHPLPFKLQVPIIYRALASIKNESSQIGT